jgi:glycosyltransferase involved in cell wall biosynthesis
MKADLKWSIGLEHPKLASVIVTAYNQAWVLAETLESVAAQTYRPLECVVIDDGSTDRTQEIVSDFVRKYSNRLAIKSIRQRNQGAQAARNFGVEASSGEFIQFLDGDDLLEPGKISSQVEVFGSGDGRAIDAVYGDARWLLEGETEFRAGDDTFGHSRIGVGPTDDLVVSLLYQPRWNPPFAYLCRRTAVEKAGPWDPAIRINQDYAFFLRMACLGLRFKYTPVMTGYYRHHSQPRISEGRLLMRAQDTLMILQSAERLLETRQGLTAERRRALAYAFRRISHWTFSLDKRLWRESLSHSLRLCPDLKPERHVSRLLQCAIGVWKSETILGFAREWKRRISGGQTAQSRSW